MQEQKPILHKRIFWDVDFDKIDYQNKAAFVIERVFERGDVDDIRQARRFYGDDVIVNVLKNLKYLSDIRLYLAAAIYNLEPSQFRCYTEKQSMKELWSF